MSHHVTFLVATYGTDGELHPEIIFGSDRKFDSRHSLPTEGIYMVCQHRALQIATRTCELKPCSRSQICSCDTSSSSSSSSASAYHRNEDHVADQPPTETLKFLFPEPCLGKCSADWLQLYGALATEARSLEMHLLAQPACLNWARSCGHYSFHYDIDLRDQRAAARHVTNNNWSRPLSTLLGSIKNTWDMFINALWYPPEQPAITAPRSDSSDSTDNADSKLDDSGWVLYDVSVVEPSWPAHRDQDDNHGSDVFKHTIEEEEEIPLGTRAVKLGSLSQPAEEPTLAGDVVENIEQDENENVGVDEDEDVNRLVPVKPVPVIIPPKNFAVGRILTRAG
ncbi:hypothetical protein F4778DRAFT_735215 [Xylariomycetidae sp. FL2044]|nr:hypothetical protein F4778DRAFT_735215 [Xylariomycetidae sp. FL2044]